MKFCPQCGQKLMDFDLEGKPKYVQKPERYGGKMRIAAGIMLIITGIASVGVPVQVADMIALTRAASYEEFLELSWSLATSTPAVLATVVLLVLIVGGGICALRKKAWAWALSGAICSMIAMGVFAVFLALPGLLAVIFLAKRKGEFSSHETAMQGDERSECLSYYKDEKKLRLLYESVEKLFDKRLGKYENVYFRARKGQRCPEWNWEDGGLMSIMAKISDVHEYFSDAATEIVNRKKAMRPAPLAASAMSSAWLAAYLDYEALRHGLMVAGFDAVEVALRQARAKELFANFNKSIHKAWKEEREFRKHLNLSSDEYQNIVARSTIAVAADDWLRKLEAECP